MTPIGSGASSRESAVIFKIISQLQPVVSVSPTLSVYTICCIEGAGLCSIGMPFRAVAYGEAHPIGVLRSGKSCGNLHIGGAGTE